MGHDDLQAGQFPGEADADVAGLGNPTLRTTALGIQSGPVLLIRRQPAAHGVPWAKEPPEAGWAAG